MPCADIGTHRYSASACVPVTVDPRSTVIPADSAPLRNSENSSSAFSSARPFASTKNTSGWCSVP